ncbi:LOW QUALITY PROTEIN: Uncharacterized protein PHPALM_14070 [Phytophthora palmivora]|uniref:Uncharacterized protein n=1 Tax=Phytophthora palmivora TaxID=4796 RepID=A0A2P4XVQ7_9STRA|nr:LOW QUALITY PROTEIN: Uncharacterized protein PHPALM_14070 [Phytophthora palmivora]
MELNNWYLTHDYLRSLTEPCMQCLPTSMILWLRPTTKRTIFENFGYENAHRVGNPMESNIRLDLRIRMRSFDYRKAIGMLTYSTTVTRPVLAFAVGKLCRSAANPCTRHVESLKRVFRYIASTVDYGISYERPAETATYSASTVEKATIDCRRDIYEIAPPASVKTNPIVLFRDSGSLVQSLSQKPSNIIAVAVSNTLQEVLPQKSVEIKLGIDNQAANLPIRHVVVELAISSFAVISSANESSKESSACINDNNLADMFTKLLCKQRL